MKRRKANCLKGLSALAGAALFSAPALGGTVCNLQLDDGTQENGLGSTTNVAAFGVPVATSDLDCGTIDTVQVMWGTVSDGTTAQIVFQDDPNDDGIPNDIAGSNLACVEVTVQDAGTDTFVSYDIDPPVDVSGEGIVFVSVVLEHGGDEFPMNLDQDGTIFEQAWFTGLDPGADLCDPYVDGGAVELTGAGLPGNYMIRIGSGEAAPCVEDIDGDDTVGVPDLLDLLSQWGGPGSADFDGSGDVGVPDLLQLLGAWGECPEGGGLQLDCGNFYAGDCCGATNTPFCNNESCCETVCAIDSFCCDMTWDQLCADIASDECPSCTGPSNDNCDAPQEVGLGMFDYSTINANTDGNPLPELCAIENDTLGFGKDVWFCYTHKDPDGPVTASICDLDYDGRMAVYEDCSTCPPPDSNIIGCNDDGCGDVGGGSIVAFNAVQGETYLIRVGGWSPDVPANASEGNGTLTVELGGSPPAPGGNIFDPISVDVGETVGWDSTGNPSSANLIDCGEGLPNGPTVFFEVTGDGTTMTASTCTTALEVDTTMTVVCGEVGDLACVGANDDNFGNVDCFDNNAGVGGSEVSWCTEDGQTYIIAVWASNGGEGELSVSSDGTPCSDPVSCAVACQVCDCPAGAIDENEACGDDNNSGCNVTPPSFQDVSAGDVICGTAWADAGTRDTDWYRVTVGSSGNISATLTSTGPQVVFIVDISDCGAPAVLGTIGFSEECESSTASANGLEPGTDVAVFTAFGNADGSGVFEGFPCASCGADQQDFSYTLEIDSN